MKHLFTLCLFLFAGTQVLSAQADSIDYRRFQVGVVAGRMIHEVDFTPNQTIESVTGDHYGVAVRYFDRQLVGFQAELTYGKAGWRQILDPEDDTNFYERRTQYADLQLLTQFSIGRGVVQPMIQAGPYLSFPLGEEETLPPDYDPATQPNNTYFDRELPFRLGYGLRAGVGLNIELGALTIQADGRLLQGFSNIIKSGESPAETSIRKAYGGQVTIFLAL